MPRVRFPFPEKDDYFAVRKCLIGICGGDHCAASLLDCLIYWDGVKRGSAHQEITRASLDSKYSANTSLWIYKSIVHWSEDLCGHYGDSAIRSGIKTILSKGYATTRPNPTNPLDRTPQYLLDYDTVVKALKRWESNASDFASADSLKTTNASVGNENVDSLKTTNAFVENNECSYTETTCSETTLNPPTPISECEKQNPEQNLDLEDDVLTFVEHIYSRTNRRAKLVNLRARTNEGLVENIRRAENQWGPPTFRAALIAYLQFNDVWVYQHRWPIEYFLKSPSRYIRLSENLPQPAASQPRPATPPPIGDLQHPPAAQAAPTGSQIDFTARWNELVPEAPADRMLLPADPKAWRDPLFAERFDEICAKARELIQAGADLKFGFLLKTEKDTGVFRWQQLLAGELSWMKPKPKNKKQQSEDFLETERKAIIARREAAKRARADSEGTAGNGVVGSAPGIS